MKCNLKNALEEILLDSGQQYNADHIFQVSYHLQKLAEHMVQMPEQNNRILLDYFSDNLTEFFSFVADNLNMRPIITPPSISQIMQKMEEERNNLMQMELPITEE